VKLSPVLEAMGVAPEVGMGAIRFSLGRDSSLEEVSDVAARLADIVPKMIQQS
jgi:cysteine desulfurase